MYTPPDKAAIASLAFHPTDHVLLIATSNKLLFWSWDQPEPFACIQTASVEEKVRYSRPSIYLPPVKQPPPVKWPVIKALILLLVKYCK